MLYEIGLITCVATCGWIALDSLFAPGSRRRSLPLGGVALCAGLWSGAEILLRHPSSAAELRVGRWILYAGISFFSVCWLWMAARAARPRWWVRSPWLLAVAALPLLFSYSSLFWSTDGILTSLKSPLPRPGPLFPYSMGYAWTLMAVGAGYLVAAAYRLRRANLARMTVLVAGVLIPLAGNALYNLGRLFFDYHITDPTPVLVGLAAFFFRSSVIDSGVSLTVPISRGKVFDQIEIGILTTDLDGRVVDANSAAQGLLGEERILDRPLDSLLERARAEGGRVLDLKRYPIRGPMGMMGTGVVVTDRTREELAERRLRMAARLEAVGSLTAGIAHEVNNPLAYIRANLGQLEKLAEYLAMPEVQSQLPNPVQDPAADARELVAETQDGIERITRLVERLRSFARDEPVDGEVRSVDLAIVAEKAIAMASPGVPPGMIDTRFASSASVMAAESDLVQIVLNLLVNAIHATDRCGPIEVVVDDFEDGVRLRVMDRGIGIPESVREHIFDPFFTTKTADQGSGLGLSLSQDLARRHGGRVEGANREGGGAVFSLWLPAAGGGSTPTPARHSIGVATTARALAPGPGGA